MAKNPFELDSIVRRGIDQESIDFLEKIQGILKQSDGATGEFPEQKIAGALNRLKDADLLKVQENLESLSDALKLWLGKESTGEVAERPTPSGLTDSGNDLGSGEGKGVGELKTASPTSISIFLQSVGNAVFEAQNALDKTLIAPNNEHLSAAYRIPKLSAEIAFEVEKVDERGVSILLASRNSSERESLKQKVSFDIVATPLPAELSARNQLAAIIFNRLEEGDPWRKRLAGATLVRQARGTLALSLEGEGGPEVLVAPDVGDAVTGPLKLDRTLGKALESIAGKA